MIAEYDSESSNNDDGSNNDESIDNDVDSNDEGMMQLAALLVKSFEKMGYKGFKKRKKFPKKGSNSNKEKFRKKNSKEYNSNKLDKSRVKCYNCNGICDFATEFKKI